MNLDIVSYFDIRISDLNVTIILTIDHFNTDCDLSLIRCRGLLTIVIIGVIFALDLSRGDEARFKSPEGMGF